jgi:lipopolysaccharide exporter
MSISDEIDRPPVPIAEPALSTSPLRQIARGSMWMVAARWGLRGVGLISTIVLARLLRPADFGVVAMAMVAMGFVRVFAETGQDLAVIRHANPTAEHFDTAWTMSVCAGFLVGLALIASAPLAGWYYHEPRVVPVIRMLALAPVIEGFNNVGVVAGFRRNLDFGNEFRFMMTRKLSVFVAVVPLALILRDYWALVWGILCGISFTAAASYWLHPYRPRFRLTKLRELWSFSGWTQFAQIGDFLGNQADQIVVGGLAGALQMGAYNVASDLATAPTNELVMPAARVAFPVYAKLLHDPARLTRSYLDVLSIVAIVALSTGVGVGLVAPDMVAVVLGPKWAAAAPLMPWLAVGGGIFGLTLSVKIMVSVTGNARLNAMCSWAFAALLLPATVVAGLRWGVVGIAAARLAVTVLFFPVMFYTLMQVIPITARQIAECLWRPALAALAMAAVVILSGTDAIAPVALRLVCNVALGAATFATALLALWFLAGRPEGAECMLVTQLGRLRDLRMFGYRLRFASAAWRPLMAVVRRSLRALAPLMKRKIPSPAAPLSAGVALYTNGEARDRENTAAVGSLLPPAEAGMRDDSPLSDLR